MKLNRALALTLSLLMVTTGMPLLAQTPQQQPTTPQQTPPAQDPAQAQQPQQQPDPAQQDPAVVTNIPADKAADTTKQKTPKKGSKDDVDDIGNRDVSKGINWFSLEKEIQLGKALAMQVERQSHMVDDPVISEYVNRVGQNLVRNSDAKVPFTIKVIDDDTVNAFALPGGFFFVQTGVIMEADEEAELAGVMAHEIAHVAARHGTRGQTRAELMQLATIPLIFMGGLAPYLVRQASGLIIPMGYMQFSRGFEREADMLGLQYMYKAGYDPQAFVTFFEKIQAKEKRKPGTLSKMFASHPQTPDRIAATQKEIATVLPPRDEHIVTTSEFDDVKARLEQMHNRRKQPAGTNDPNRPTLRRTSTAKDDPTTATDSTTPASTDDRPTLKRRDP
jgi:predicted Zn-dependent protease